MTSAIRARREAEDGFTLIELLVVVIIIGILAAIAIPAFLNQRQRAYESEAKSDVRNYALEIEAQATANNGRYVAAASLVSAPTGVGDNVTFLYASSGPTEFTLCGTHVLLTDANADTAVYDSNGGGLLDNMAADCSAAEAATTAVS